MTIAAGARARRRGGRGMAAACLAAALCAACDAPSVPSRADVYPFTLQTASGPAVLHWPLGATVRVALADGGSGEANLRTALDAAVAAWNGAALYGEYRLAVASSPADADVVLAASTAPLPVDVSACPPALGGFGVTSFCLDSTGRALQRYPLLGGGGHVDMLVLVLDATAADPAATRRTVAHELGHVLGLARHSPNPGDLMAELPITDQPQAADRATVLALYHTPATVRP